MKQNCIVRYTFRIVVKFQYYRHDNSYFCVKYPNTFYADLPTILDEVQKIEKAEFMATLNSRSLDTSDYAENTKTDPEKSKLPCNLIGLKYI